MPDYDYEEMKKEAEQYIKFEKDKKNRIAYITFDRPDAQNSTTLGMRQNYADLIHKCNVDDDVKVVVIRGEGEDFGSGGDLPGTAGHAGEPRHAAAARAGDQRRRGEVSAGRLLPLSVDGHRLLRQSPGGKPAIAGAAEDQHHRGEGLLLRLALLPGRRRRPRRLVR